MENLAGDRIKVGETVNSPNTIHAIFEIAWEN